MCRRSPPACDRRHIRQPVPAARFTAVLPRGSGGDTGGARRNRQGWGHSGRSVFGGPTAEGAGQERGRPPPRPVGISDQARSVTAGAGLAFRGRLAGAPRPLPAAGIAGPGNGQAGQPEPKDPKGRLTRLDGPGTSRLATARPGVDGVTSRLRKGRLGSGPPSPPTPARGCGPCGPARRGRGQSGRPRRWGAGPRRPVDAGALARVGDRLPAVSSSPSTCKAPLATRSVPARAASSEGRGVQNSRMAEAMASGRARSSSVPRAALALAGEGDAGPATAAFEQVDGGPRPPPMARTYPPGGATGGRHRTPLHRWVRRYRRPFDLTWPYGVLRHETW